MRRRSARSRQRTSSSSRRRARPHRKCSPPYRDHAAQLGCDGIIVYTEANPIIKAGPTSKNESLVLEPDGVLSSKVEGVSVPNPHAVFVHTARKGGAIVVDAPSLAMCILYP